MLSGALCPVVLGCVAEAADNILTYCTTVSFEDDFVQIILSKLSSLLRLPILRDLSVVSAVGVQDLFNLAVKVLP